MDIILIIAVLLIIFGPSKIPEVAKSIGKGIKEFRKSAAGTAEDAEEKQITKVTEEKQAEKGEEK